MKRFGVRPRQLGTPAGYALGLALGLLVMVLGGVQALAAAGVSSDFSHLVLSQQQGRLRVFQLVKLKNSGDKPQAPVKISLPEGYGNLSFPNQPDASKFKTDASGVTDPDGIAAGASKDYTLVYELPFPPQGLTLNLKFNYPTDQVYVLSDQKSLAILPVQNGDWEYGGPAQMGDKQFDQFVRQQVAAGATLKLNMGPAAASPSQPGQQPAPAPNLRYTQGPIGLLNKAFHGGSSNVMLWQRFTGSPGHGGLVGIILILLGLGSLVTAVSVFIYRRWGHRNPKGPSDLVSEADLVARLNKEKALYVKKIAELDRQLAEGGLDAGEHAEKRAQYKERLVKIVAKLKELEP